MKSIKIGRGKFSYLINEQVINGIANGDLTIWLLHSPDSKQHHTNKTPSECFNDTKRLMSEIKCKYRSLKEGALQDTCEELYNFAKAKANELFFKLDAAHFMHEAWLEVERGDGCRYTIEFWINDAFSRLIPARQEHMKSLPELAKYFV